MVEIALAVLTSVVTVVFFCISIPLALLFWFDAKRMRRAGIASPFAVIRRRFFVPRKPREVEARVIGREVWLERWSPKPSMTKRAGRVVGVGDGLVIDADGRFVFWPRRESRGFARGEGAATGTLDTEERALVIFV